VNSLYQGTFASEFELPHPAIADAEASAEQIRPAVQRIYGRASRKRLPMGSFRLGSKSDVEDLVGPWGLACVPELQVALRLWSLSHPDPGLPGRR
jgi:hypothetical protein